MLMCYEQEHLFFPKTCCYEAYYQKKVRVQGGMGGIFADF